jgi:hypothetical protein
MGGNSNAPVVYCRGSGGSIYLARNQPIRHVLGKTESSENLRDMHARRR